MNNDYYVIDGYRVPGVERVLEATVPVGVRSARDWNRAKSPLSYHRRQEAQKLTDKAVRAYALARFRSERPPRNPEYQAYYQQFDEWRKQNFDGGMVWTDQTVSDLRIGIGYAGTLDAIATIDGQMSLVKIKTYSLKPSPARIEKTLIEAAAYHAAWSQSAWVLVPVRVLALFVGAYDLSVYEASGAKLEEFTQTFYRRRQGLLPYFDPTG